jgi:HK97 family phage major capsid protein
MAQTIAGLENGLVPASVATSILTRAAEQSVVRRLSGSMPMPLNGASIAVQTGHIEAGVVGEGEAKPVGGTTYAPKSIRPIKIAAIAIVSDELIRLNPAGIFDNISEDLANAITRAFDLAVLHGRSAKTGSTIAGVEYINQTLNRTTIGTASKTAGGLSADLLSGYDAVVNGSQVQNDFNGFAADSRFRSTLMGSVDVNGRPVYGDGNVNLRDGMETILGLPAAYGRVVGGAVGASADTGVRAFGGDWGALKYGFADNMTIQTSKEATIVDGATSYNLFQQNLQAVLVEATFGWVISDVDSFSAYEIAAAA